MRKSNECLPAANRPGRLIYYVRFYFIDVERLDNPEGEWEQVCVVGSGNLLVS
jgi:hypothetical protein